MAACFQNYDEKCAPLNTLSFTFGIIHLQASPHQTIVKGHNMDAGSNGNESPLVIFVFVPTSNPNVDHRTYGCDIFVS